MYVGQVGSVYKGERSGVVDGYLSGVESNVLANDMPRCVILDVFPEDIYDLPPECEVDVAICCIIDELRMMSMFRIMIERGIVVNFVVESYR